MEAVTHTEAVTRTEAATRMEAWTATRTPRWNVGAEMRGQLTGPGRKVTSAQARRRLLQLAASYPHRLLRLASSRGDESRENEIEFCVREE
jgi:hypothetical protein